MGGVLWILWGSIEGFAHNGLVVDPSGLGLGGRDGGDTART